MKKILIAIALLLIICFGWLWKTTSPASFPERNLSSDEKRAFLENVVSDWLSQHDVPGASVAYVENGRVLWARAFGEQSPGVPANESTLFNVASLTKPITAEVLLSMAADGVLSLDASMSDHWIDPDIADDDRHTLLTPALALRHRTGFPNWRYQTGDTLTFLQQPGTQTSYSGEGYAYAARYSSQLAREPFEKLADTYVFTPANADEITYTGQDWFQDRVAQPYRDGEFGEPVIREKYNAADDVYATASTYAAFMILVMERASEQTDVVKERFQVVDGVTPFFCKIRDAVCPRVDGYGLGWRVIRYDDQMIALHQGSDWGEQALALMQPAQKTGFVVLTNGSNGGKVIREIAEVLFPDEKFAAYARLQVF